MVGPIHPDPHGVHRRRYGPRPPARAHTRRPAWRWLWWLPLGFVGVSLLLTAPLRWWAPPATAFMLAARIEAAYAGRAGFEVRHAWVPLAAQSPWMAVAAIAAEDQKFPRHHGFDVESVRAALAAKARGARLRGASTLSQQLAKNLYLWSGRSWLRKGLEAWFTVLLEALLDKRRILELYVNLVEFGPGLYGVEAASRQFFGHGAASLRPDEAALLAAVLPNPRVYDAAAPGPYLRARQRWLVAQMRQIGGAGVLHDL